MTKKEFEEILDPSRKQREERMEEMKKVVSSVGRSMSLNGALDAMYGDNRGVKMHEVYRDIRLLSEAILLLMEAKSSDDGV